MTDHHRDFAVDRGLLRLSAIAAAIGLLGAIAAFVLLKLICFFTNLFFYQSLSFADRSPAGHHLGAWVILLPALGGLVVGLIARFGSDRIRGHGIPEAIEAILFGRSRMSPKVAVLKPLASGIAIGSGGPFGAEGPIIMTGGAIGSLVAQHFHLSAAERKTLLVAGAAAGMTAVFGTPVAAVLLAVELLLFEWRPRSLLPVIVAAAVAGFARPMLVEGGPLFPLRTAAAVPATLLSCVLAGLAGGALSAAMSALLYKVEDAFARLPVHWMWWPALGGLVVGLGGWLEPRALGVGYDAIGDLLNARLGLELAAGLLAVKALVWVVALGSNTSGGVLAPLLMLGAGMGLVLSPLLPGGSPQLWALVCMAAVLAGTLGAPLTAAVFALGLTGDFPALLPLLLAAGVSYGLTVLAMPRSIMTEKIARRGRHVFREYAVDPLERHHVEEAMTREVAWVSAELDAAEAGRRHFGPAQRHRAYPVMDGGRLLGMLDREALAGADPHASLAALFAGREPVFALAGESCREVAGRMAVEGLERLPVVDEPHSLRLVGLVSRSDLVGLSRHFFDEERLRERPLGLRARG